MSRIPFEMPTKQHFRNGTDDVISLAYFTITRTLKISLVTLSSNSIVS